MARQKGIPKKTAPKEVAQKSTSPTGVGDNAAEGHTKTRKHTRPGTVVLREIKKYQVRSAAAAPLRIIRLQPPFVTLPEP